jgi:hypothetical protein
LTGFNSDLISPIISVKAAANSLTAANAVYSISGITAYSVGADVNGDGVFTFTNLTGTAAFELGDTPTDGLVLVRAGGMGVLPVPTLKLVQV